MYYVLCVFCATILPTQDQRVELDFTRISQPVVASQLELSDEQRSKVADLLTERINKLAAAKPADRAAIRSANNDALKALLSPTQLAKYQVLLKGGKLRFNFRGENWADVLNWFASESELSLVMNETPPGDFTYSDQKEYSSPQAIDLLNSILLSKGYTLIRREKMLIVANLTTGIPYELVPTETLEGLALRGKFEWVRIKFPLQGRPIAAVLDEVKPMISNNGMATALTASGQLMVTETAGKMEAIGVLVSAVPIPTPPPKPPKAPDPPPNIFVVHSAKGLDIDGTVETIQKFFATTSVAGDAKAEEIQVYAPQAQQDLIKSSLDKMISNASTELRVFTDVYPIDRLSIANVQEQLSTLFPETKFTIDTENSRLVVSANTKTHGGVKETLTKLGASSQATSDKTVFVYSVAKEEAENLATVLSEMLPRAQVIVQGNRIAVRANPSDHLIAKSLVDQISSTANPKTAMLLRFYDLNENLSDITTTIQAMAKEGTVTWLESRKKLSVIADAKTHELVKKTIEQVNLDLPKPKPKSLKIFNVSPAQKEKFSQVFAELVGEFGDASLITGAAPNEIAILADTEQQAAVESVINSLANLKSFSEKELTAIEISVDDSAQLVTLLNEKLKGIEFLVNPEKTTLFAWISKPEIESVKKTVKTVEALLPKKLTSTLEVYEVTGSVEEIVSFISPIASSAKVTSDAANQRIVVWANSLDHAKIKATIDKVDVLSKKQKSLEIYELKNAAASVAQTMISNLDVDATVTTSEDSKSILVWAAPEDHVRIKSMVDRLSVLKTTQQSQVALYSVDRAAAETTLSAVQAVFPDANLSLDASSEKIICIADEELQVQIKSLVEKLQPAKPSTPKVLMSYELKHSDAALVVGMLSDLHPEIRFAADERANRVLVTAELGEQPRFKAIIGQLDAKASDRDEKVLETYPIDSTKTTVVTDLIQPLLPDMKFSVDETSQNLVAVGTPFEQQKLAKLLGQIKDGKSENKILKNYSTGSAPIEEVQNVLLQVVPSAIIAVNGGEGKMVVWATAEEQKLIESAINQLNNVGGDMSLKNYDLNKQVTGDILTLLQGLSKTARLALSTDGKQLVIYATESDQKLFAGVVDELIKSDTSALSLKAYVASDDVISSTSAVVVDSFPNAKLVVQPDAGKLVIWASNEDHAKIQKAIDDLKSQLSKPKTPKTTVIYPLGKATKLSVIDMINSDVEDAIILSDSQTDRIIVRANSETHLAVEQIVSDLKKTFDIVGEKTIKSHAVRNDIKAQATTTIASLLPAVEFITNGDDTLILVKATANDHESVDELIKTLDTEIARKTPRTIASYELTNLEKMLAIQILSNRFPEITFVTEDNTSRLLTWANPGEHNQIPLILKGLEAAVAVENEKKVEVYNIDAEKMIAADVLDLIDSKLKENLTIQVATATNSLVVRASAAQHAKLKSAVDAVVMQIKPLPKPTSLVYEFPLGNALAVSQLVSPLLSNTTISVAADGKKLIATSNMEGHNLIASVLDQLKDEPQSKDTETIVYKMNAATPSVINSAIAAMSPKARITADDSSMSLIVTTSKVEHAVIANILKQINDSSLGKKTEVFVLKTASPASLVSAISALVSNSSVTADVPTNSVVVTALATDFPQIQSIVDKLDMVAGDRIGNVVAKVYPFDQKLVDAVDMQAVIDEDLREGMSVRVNEIGNGLIIRTTPEKHQQLALIFEQVIAQIPASQKIETRVYPLSKADPNTIENVLSAKFAQSDFAVDANTRTVVATISVAEHVQLKTILDQMDSSVGDRIAASKAFKLKVATPRIVGSAIESLLPNAIVDFDIASKTVIVTGTEEELKSAGDLVLQVDGSDLGKTTQVYKLVEADPRFVSPAIEQLLPDAKISADRYSKALFVTATEEEHQQVAKMVDELNTKKGQRSEVYKLNNADARYVMPAVQSLLPNATVTGDRISKLLFVTGTDDDHAQVEKLVEKMNAPKSGQRSEVYKLIEADPRYLTPAIQALLPNATVSGDRYSKTVFVTGTDEDHKQVAVLIEKLNGRGTGQTTEVYKLAKASSVIIEPALSALIPDGNVTADKISNTVVVSASAEDQAKVASVIEKLDKATGDELQLIIYRSKFENADPLNQVIANLFRDDPEVRINFEWENQRILIVTTEVKHQLIKSLIEQVDQAKPKYENRFAKVYHLENIDSGAAEGIIRNLYGWWAPRIEVRREQGTNALIVVATDQQHQDLGKSIKEVDGDLRQLEVFQLVNVEPYTVELAIEQLFAEIKETMRPSATSDLGTQQLFVRGTEAQIKLIREMLKKMGESFQDETSPSAKGGVRTIPFRGNAMDALREIEAFWPRIRKNKIEIIRSGGPKIKRNYSPRISDDTVPEKKPDSDNPPTALDSQPSNAPEDSVHGGCGGQLNENENENKSVDDVADSKQVQEPQKPIIQIEGLRPVKRNDASKQEKETLKKQGEDAQIIVIAGDNEVTIASSDLEALDQLEYLLRTIQRGNRGGLGSSNFAVYLLSNSSAKDTAKLLTDLFEAIPESERLGSVGNAVFVAEDRLNAMVVYGTRKERDVIQEIIEVLDAEDLPDSLTTPSPELIQIENSSADRILKILESVYSNQLTSGGGRRTVEIPEGVTTAVASMLQQINAATTGPILTLGMDENTNSIVMRAPMELGREIKTFVERLDSIAKVSPAKKIRVLKMEGTNAARVRSILNGMTNAP